MALVPLGSTTVTSTVPNVPGGAIATICVAELTVKLVAFVAPNLTSVASAKPVPVMKTRLPPAKGPELGATDVN